MLQLHVSKGPRNLMQGDNRMLVTDPRTGNVVGEYHYIDPLMIHEFGHTLGLPDFCAMTPKQGLRA